MQHNRSSLSSKARPKPPTARRLSGNELLDRVRAAEKSLRAIPLRGLDALVMSAGRGTRVVTWKGGESPYRMLVEAINEGAATVSSDGVVLYCNRSLAGLIGLSPPQMIGTMLQGLVSELHRDRLTRFLHTAGKHSAKAEFEFRTRDGSLVPVQLSLNALSGYRGKALGVVITDLTEERRRQKKQIQRAEAIHRLVLGREILAQEAERKRIARELHDEAGQLMTSLLVALRQIDESRNVGQCRQLAKRLRQLTGQTIEEVGRLARGLHPITLDDHGLVPALSRYVQEYSQTHRISVNLSLDPLESTHLTPAAEIALYRIVQEALTNVAKHAGARNVKVICRHAPRALEMAVIDDGIGFKFSKFSNMEAASDSSHLGLQSIRERSALLGGTASFTSTPRGVEVRVRIPFPNRELTSRLKPRHS